MAFSDRGESSQEGRTARPTLEVVELHRSAFRALTTGYQARRVVGDRDGERLAAARALRAGEPSR